MQGMLLETPPPAVSVDVGRRWEDANLSIENVRDPFESDTFRHFDLDHDDMSRTRDAVEDARHLPGVDFIIRSFVGAGDYATPYHSGRVAWLTAAAVIRAGGDDGAVLDAAATGWVHDAGKLWLQDVVHVPRPLTDQEFERVKWHPVDTVLLVARLGLSCTVQYTAGNHHGYQKRNPYAAFPDRLWTQDRMNGDDGGDSSSLSAEHLIATALASADSYDASASGRPERLRPRSHQDSIRWVNELTTPDEVKRIFASLFQRHVAWDYSDFSELTPAA